MSCLNSSLPRQPYSQAVLVGVGSEEDSPPSSQRTVPLAAVRLGEPGASLPSWSGSGAAPPPSHSARVPDLGGLSSAEG